MISHSIITRKKMSKFSSRKSNNNSNHKFRWYQGIYEKFPLIIKDAKRISSELGLDRHRDEFGLYAGSSSCPGGLPDYVLDAIVRANKARVLPLRIIEDEIREIVKDVYGDEYDAAVTNTNEAGLRVSLEILTAPPTMRKGDAYRGRLITPYGEDYEYFGAYGRPFPPKYKNINIDRTVTAGELGVEGKSLNNLDALFVPYAGARYEVHGIKQNTVSLLTTVDVEKTAERVRQVAERHAELVTGLGAIGYNTPGWGHGDKDKNGTPRVLKLFGDISMEFDVPYILDCASGLPFIGVDPRDIDADIMVWSMDKAGRAPTCGLVIGKEDVMVPVRKGLGYGGQRWGEVSSHSKALFSMADPGRDTLIGLHAYLKMLKNDPDKIKRPVDQFHKILIDEFSSFEPSRFREKMLFTKSYSMGGSELNYAHTWDGEGFGIPLFSIEDLFANTNPICLAQEAMGIVPTTMYSGNIFLSPGLGTLDENAELNEEFARIGIRALVKSMEIVCKHAGLDD